MATSSENSSSPAQGWIQNRFLKRECVHIVPSSNDSPLCGCGRYFGCHEYFESEEDHANDSQWSVHKCTVAYPTDSFGSLIFKGSPAIKKPFYLRTDISADPKDLWRLLVDVWGFPVPKLIIFMHGSGDDDHKDVGLHSAFTRELKHGLAKVSSTEPTWIITSGLKSHVNMHVTAAFTETWRHKWRNTYLIGFSPWGLVRRDELVNVHGGQVIYETCSRRGTNDGRRSLCDGHSAYVLVDDGTVSQSSARTAALLRRRFEYYCRRRAKTSYKMLALMVGGGRSTFDALIDYTSVEPCVPIVLCAGVPGASDWTALIYEYCLLEKDANSVLILRRPHRHLQHLLEIDKHESNRLMKSLVSSFFTKRHLFTVFDTTVCGTAMTKSTPDATDLDAALLKALLNGSDMSQIEKLNLAVVWDNHDVAKQLLEAGLNGGEWSSEALEQAMMNALMYDRVDCVKLLLMHGTNMDRFLTISRLEELYNSDTGPSNTLGFVLNDVVKLVDQQYQFQLSHIGLIIEKLVGCGYRSSYCRREFRRRYKNDCTPKQCESDVHQKKRGASIAVPCRHRPHFTNPYHELFLWAVLTNRKQLAMCFWQNGHDHLAKALLGYRLYQSLAVEAEEDYLEMAICQQLQTNANEFKKLAYELLAQCYETDDDLTLQLLTYELRYFSKFNCISMSAWFGHEPFVAHQSCQLLLSDLWLGGLRLRKSVNAKVIVGILFPPLILTLTFKSRQELQWQPQTAEEIEAYRAKGIEREHEARTMTLADTTDDEDDRSSVSSFESHAVDTKLEAGRRGPSPSSGSIAGAASATDRDSVFWIQKETNSDQPAPSNAQKRQSIQQERRYKRSLASDPVADPSSVIGKDGRLKESASVDLCSQVVEPIDDDDRITSKRPSVQISYLGETLKARKLRQKPLRRFATSDCIGVAQLDVGNLADRIPDFVKAKLIKKREPLDARWKISEFYSAPITAFWFFTLGYLLFLSAFTYTVLVKTSRHPTWPEYYVIAFIGTYTCDHIRKMIMKEPRRLSSKLLVWLDSQWDVCTFLACCHFLISLTIRIQPSLLAVGRVLYSLNIVFWYLRVLRLFGVSPSLSPYVLMYGKMVMRLVLMSAILFVLISSFGVFREAMTDPDDEWDWSSLRNIFYKPYWFLYGVLFVDEIAPCADEGTHCTAGYWLPPLFMTIYLLLAFVVFFSMMVAAMSDIFTEINERTQEIAKFQSYQRVMEFEQQSFLPPPFVAIAHVYALSKYVYRRCCKRDKGYRFDHTLKLFLTPEERMKLHDFERICLEEYLSKKQEKEASSVEGRLRTLTEKMDNLTEEFDNLRTKTESHSRALNSLERRFDAQVAAVVHSLDDVNSGLTASARDSNPVLSTSVASETRDSSSWLKINRSDQLIKHPSVAEQLLEGHRVRSGSDPASPAWIRRRIERTSSNSIQKDARNPRFSTSTCDN